MMKQSNPQCRNLIWLQGSAQQGTFCQRAIPETLQCKIQNSGVISRPTGE